ncbi:PDR/VanB family oxidoreductase [Variovorax sp. KK3]|uniref:PDR/VanB family oxidoreductase n=1 Tax=Variovorax sp. KK3 TaxID=1855728 RepID=UPI003AAE6066
MKLIVTRAEPAAEGIRRIELRSGDGAALPAFTPGAHLKFKLVLPNGQASVREYSLVSTPDERDRYEIAVLREPAGTGGSAAMHALAVGDVLEADGPFNEFALAEQAREHLLIAGGIGITPILCMARALASRGAAMQLHYAARAPECMAYRDEAAALPGATLYFDQGDPARGMPLDAVLADPGEARHLYVCGPRGLIAGVLERAEALGWPAERLHYESFKGAVALANDRPIRLVLRGSGRTLDVKADQSILDALIAAGLDPLYDCRRGECGMCMTPVLEGLPDHRDHALSAAERADGKVICTCVSRALTPELVLDL